MTKVERESISERELLDNALNKGLKDVWIEKKEKFELRVKLTWKEGVFYLRENRNQKAKGWKSVDRLIQHFDGKPVFGKKVEIYFNNGELENE